MNNVSKTKTVTILYLVAFLLTGAFCLCAFIAANKCYLKPCYQEGLELHQKINHGKGFQLVFTGLVFLVYELVAIRSLNRAPTPFGVGCVLGVHAACVLVALQTAAMWGSEVIVVKNLSDMVTQTGSLFAVNTVAKSTFAAVTAFASLLFVIFVVLGALVFWWRADLAMASTETPVAYYEGVERQGFGAPHDPSQSLSSGYGDGLYQ